jgi:hypothetical protein
VNVAVVYVAVVNVETQDFASLQYTYQNLYLNPTDKICVSK